MTRRAGETVYTPPRVQDYGSLVELTADFDLNFVGSFAKVLTIAAASAPMPGGGGEPPDGSMAMNPPPGGDMPGALPDTGPALTDLPGNGGAGGGQGGGGVLSETKSGGGIPTEGGTQGEGLPGAAGGATLPGSEAAGRLPFTGYVAWSYAAAGAAMTTAGVTLRQMLRRDG